MQSKVAHIINRILNGDQEAEYQLYQLFRSKWYMLSLRYAQNKYDADDILQEGLIQVYKDLHQYDASKSNFATWSNRVLVHAALKFLKRNSWNNTFKDIDTAISHASSEDDIFDRLSAQELTLLLQALPTGYRLVFNLFAIEGYSHKEIALMLDINVGTSKSQLSKARTNLQKILETQLITKA